MEHVAHSLIPTLPEGHLVRQWWEGVWPGPAAGFKASPRPDWVGLDGLRDAAGSGLVDRAVLVEALQRQYAEAAMPLPKRVQDLLDPAARTVTTGHQLCLATGPAFTYYKVRTAVALARRLEKRWGTPVIPVFWLASEDHDFDEIAALWDGEEWMHWTPKNPDEVGGPVGRICIEGLAEFLSEWGRKAGLTPHSSAALGEACHGTLSRAMRHWMHQWFGPDEVVVLDGDEASLKAEFSEMMRREWTEGVTHREVTQVNAVLEGAGHAPQVHVRPINLFHLSQGGRHRVEGSVDHGWQAGTSAWPDADAVAAHVDQNPDSLSPNALLRPIYQSWLLPDVAVVGGLAEVAYWLQLSTAYPAFGMKQPALVPREGGWCLDAQSAHEMRDWGLDLSKLGQGLEVWEQAFMDRNSPPTASLWRNAVAAVAADVEEAFSSQDASLAGSVRATRAKIDKLLDKLDQQGRRALRRECAPELERLAALHRRLHPGGGAQERSANLHALLSGMGEVKPLEAAEKLGATFDEGHDPDMWTPKLHFWTAERK